MICPFYGKHAVEEMTLLVTQGGNECALITGKYAPCEMEIGGQRPELENCRWNGTGQAIKFAQFENRVFAPSVDYPD